MLARLLRSLFGRFVFFCFSLILCCHPLLAYHGSSMKRVSIDDRMELVNLFDNTDFDRAFVTQIFLDKRLVRIPVVVSKNVHNEEKRSHYDDFLSSYSIHMAKKFSRKWRTLLSRASDKFGVDKEIIVAVLLVETGFGNVLGKFPIISVFSSIILENNKRVELCEQGEIDDCQNDYVSSRLRQKSDWAKEELFALLKIAQTRNQNPYLLKGSYAGAFGIPQFLPSSYLKWGFDSDSNGSVNLFWFPDAIYSTANFLKQHGWQKGLYRDSNKDVLLEYNHSRLYVDTVFQVAWEVRKYNVKMERKRLQQDNDSQYSFEERTKKTNNPS